jgi:hypothetical protein
MYRKWCGLGLRFVDLGGKRLTVDHDHWWQKSSLELAHGGAPEDESLSWMREKREPTMGTITMGKSMWHDR